MKTKRISKKPNVAVETNSQTTQSAPAQELPAVAVEAPPKAPAVAEKPSKLFQKGQRVRFRPWDQAEGPLTKEGVVLGCGHKWVTISRTTPEGKVITDWADAKAVGSCEAIETSQTA